MTNELLGIKLNLPPELFRYELQPDEKLAEEIPQHLTIVTSTMYRPESDGSWNETVKKGQVRHLRCLK